MQAFEVHATTKFVNPPLTAASMRKNMAARITVYIVVSCVFLSTLIPYSNTELLG